MSTLSHDLTLLQDPANVTAHYAKAEALLTTDPGTALLLFKGLPPTDSRIIKCKAAMGISTHLGFQQLQMLSSSQQDKYCEEACRMANLAIQREDYLNTIEMYHTILKALPSYAPALTALGFLYIKVKRYPEALSTLVNLLVFHQKVELSVYISIIESLFALKYVREAYNLILKVRNTHLDVYAIKALRLSGKVRKARTFAESLIRSGGEKVELSILEEYGRILVEMNDPTSALNAYLGIFTRDHNYPGIRSLLVEVLNHPPTYTFFCSQMKTYPSVAHFYEMLSQAAKYDGNMEMAIDLDKKSLAIYPDSVSYTLSLLHNLEVTNEYSQAYMIAEALLRSKKDVKIGPLYLSDVCILLDNLTAMTLGTAPQPPHDPQPYNHIELEWMSILFTLVKICYVLGFLKVLVPLCRLISNACEGQDFENTVVKNEHSYYACISKLMEYEKAVHPKLPKLYVAGDSHCLALAWSTIMFKGQLHQMVPLLVTGLKIWHLRPQSTFYPKVNFYNVMKKVPPGSNIMFMFGEIDCREGFMKAVQKCKYPDLDTAMRYTVNLYMDILESFDHNVYVHPVAPVLDATRHVVVPFVEMLKTTIKERKKITYLDFFEELIIRWDRITPMPAYWGQPPRTDVYFRREYDLDLTHMNPTYIPVLEAALSKI
jgi:tetratricopeptide (TPR) repeat protein